MIAVVIIFFILTSTYIILLFYYLSGWNNIAVFEDAAIMNSSTFISVIIPARNEAKNLPELLKSLSAQTYPSHLFEVIIIDDHSTDNSASIIKKFPAKNIKLISLSDYTSGAKINSYKKKAIETGINQSKGTLIVTTDADCYFLQGWLQTIALFYEKFQPVFIAAPVSINCDLRFIEIFQSLDFMMLQGITGAAVFKKIHSMCNGANMAYEKKAFYEAGGFAGIDDIASGDDMLLMHKIYKLHPEKTMFLKSEEAIVYTQPVKTFKQFFNQRIRWASKADKYDDRRILPVLVMVYLFNLTMLVLPFIATWNNYPVIIFRYQSSMIEIWGLALLLKTLTELIFLYPVAKFFHKRSLLWLFPLMQPFHIIYTVIAGLLGKFGSYQWKERKVK